MLDAQEIENGFIKSICCAKFQINKVPAGGRTVFPRIGVSVKPIAGSAIFWYNLLETGEPDRLTLHGACPVLYGTKWGKNFLAFECRLIYFCKN